ncbi:hypothetical protein CALVIDRAFT_538487 [Calocera viscosa TUFC12733]|uniref:Uncharacterized protein n=1 Tax=Calocera viscosa (strain TUFC12733) TaxID=1330018 RepID=A0A167KUA0_CALVF|nr:hypothetical protein CALVIDRAFT_538487 [Calocera viscosa TUFC12733]
MVACGYLAHYLLPTTMCFRSLSPVMLYLPWYNQDEDVQHTSTGPLHRPPEDANSG